MQFDFLALLVVYIDFRLVVILLLVVRGSEGFLPLPPSWPDSWSINIFRMPKKGTI